MKKSIITIIGGLFLMTGCAPLVTTPPDVPIGGTIYPPRYMAPPPPPHNAYRPAPPMYVPSPDKKPSNKPSYPAPPPVVNPTPPPQNNKPSNGNGNAIISRPNTTQPGVNNSGNKRNPGTGLNVGGQNIPSASPGAGTVPSKPVENGANRR